MKAAYIRDAVALIEFSEILATSMANGDTWTELKAAETLEKLRSAQKYAKGPSFSPISAYGSNGGTKGFTSLNILIPFQSVIFSHCVVHIPIYNIHTYYLLWKFCCSYHPLQA